MMFIKNLIIIIALMLCAGTIYSQASASEEAIDTTVGKEKAVEKPKVKTKEIKITYQIPVSDANGNVRMQTKAGYAVYFLNEKDEPTQMAVLDYKKQALVLFSLKGEILKRFQNITVANPVAMDWSQE